jgi:hypothetical protein
MSTVPQTNPMPALVRAAFEANAHARAAKPRNLQPRPLKPMTEGARRHAYDPDGYWTFTPRQLRRIVKKLNRAAKMAATS